MFTFVVGWAKLSCCNWPAFPPASVETVVFNLGDDWTGKNIEALADFCCTVEQRFEPSIVDLNVVVGEDQ